MPFPILHTPFVVLSEIISLLEPKEIVTVSFCSKKARRLLKRRHQRREPLGWRLYMIDYGYWARVDIVTPHHSYPVLSAVHISVARYESEHKSIQMNGYKRGFSCDIPVLYFEDRVMGSKMIVDYVTDLFNQDVYGLIMDRNGIWAIEWINNRQEKMLNGLELVENDVYNCYGDAPLNYILRNKGATDYYKLRDKVSDNFRFDGKLGPAIQLSIHSNGHWVTLDNLKNFDFMRIEVEESRLSVSDLHSFLEHWRSGGSRRLAYLQLVFEKDTDFEHFDEELELVEKPNVVDNRLSDEEIANSLDGYSIQRDDGVKATIHFGIRHFVLIHGVVFGGAQKNLGAAGLTIVIVRKDLIGKQQAITPAVFSYKEMIANNSLYNTPPTGGIYTTNLVLKWIKSKSGLNAIYELNLKKSGLIYGIIDNSNGFYHCAVDKRYRSIMNVCFRIGGAAGNEDLEAEFLKGAAERNMISLKGHRSVGGIRASLYNAITLEETQVLATWMNEFQKAHSA
ncbi:hypothetical protein B9Z55_000448 [Caenorhabditis nigoni]|uniref:phosphoserine transaminase n=1 Tax=Caenorhabditis nigoni TaxID=1611254 RepID=A0A2G5VTG7_9PELO|nr:hypothetical protein B9Z55_000448 [Caenorhabditis nigoni]